MRRLFALPLAALLLSCDDSVRPRDPAIAIIVPDTFVIAERDSVRLTADLMTSTGDYLADQAIAWITDDTLVAVAASNGQLHFRRPGETRVVAMADGLSREALVRSLVRYDRLADGSANCARSVRGTFYCIGSDVFGRTVAVPQADDLVSLSLGSFFSCGLKADSTAWCEGSGFLGQLGNGAVVASDTLLPVTGGRRFTSVVAGESGSCGIAADSSAWCWGTGSLIDWGPAPAPFLTGHKVTAIDLSSFFGCAVTAAGTVLCWGLNSNNELGQPGPDSPVPVVVPGISSAVSVHTGFSSACAVLSNGGITCWGRNTSLQLGRTCTSPCPPGLVPGLPAMRTVTLLSTRACGLSAAPDARVYCWGTGPLGDGTTGPRAAAQPIGASGVFTALSATGTTSGTSQGFCALRDDGIVLCWGTTPAPLPFQL